LDQLDQLDRPGKLVILARPGQLARPALLEPLEPLEWEPQAQLAQLAQLELPGRREPLALARLEQPGQLEPQG